MPGPVIMLPLFAVTRIRRGDRRTATSGWMSYEWWPLPAGSMRPSSAHAGSSGITVRMPWLPLAILGTVSTTLRSAPAHSSSAETLLKRISSSRVFWVGVSSFSAARSCSASAGFSHSCSTNSWPSYAAVWTGGATARKKRVSKRLARPIGVIQ